MQKQKVSNHDFCVELEILKKSIISVRSASTDYEMSVELERMKRKYSYCKMIKPTRMSNGLLFLERGIFSQAEKIINMVIN